MDRNKRKPKFAVAGFQHETNTFSPIFAGLSDFMRVDGWPGLTEGPDVPSVFRPMNIPIGGFIAAAEGEAKLVPILWASAEPSNLVSEEAFETIAAKILAGISDAMPVDGVYLDLHGAMVTEQFEDGEGELLRRVRDLAGESMPIAISLDLHANVTEEMVNTANIVTIFRTYPHLDMAETAPAPSICSQKQSEPAGDPNPVSESCRSWCRFMRSAPRSRLPTSCTACWAHASR